MKRSMIVFVAAFLLCVGLPMHARAAETVTRIVKPGDMLSVIAEQVCGKARLYPEIAKASGIKNPDLIFPDQVLTIPCASVKTMSEYAHVRRHIRTTSISYTLLASAPAPIAYPAIVSSAPASAALPDVFPLDPSASSTDRELTNFFASSIIIGGPPTETAPLAVQSATTTQLPNRSIGKKADKTYEVQLLLAPDGVVKTGDFEGVLYEIAKGDEKKLLDTRGFAKIMFWRGNRGGKVTVSVTPAANGQMLMDVVLKKRPPEGYELAINFPAGTEAIPNGYLRAGAASTKPILKTASNKAYQPFLADMGIKQGHSLRTLASVSLFAGQTALAFSAGPIVGGISVGSTIASLVTRHRIVSLQKQRAELEAKSAALAAANIKNKEK